MTNVYLVGRIRVLGRVRSTARSTHLRVLFVHQELLPAGLITADEGRDAPTPAYPHTNL
jgi:hypothetical protein